MKLNQVLQSVLLGLILIGLFATMAQNGYGYSLMGMACFGLALLYITQLVWKVFEDYSSLEKKDLVDIAELLLLAFLILLFGFRALYISLPFSKLIFTALCILLILDYCLIASAVFNTTKTENPAVARNLIYFYTTILLFILSLVTRIFSPFLSEIIGAFGILSSSPFLISLIRQVKFDISGQTMNLFQFITASRNKSGLLFLFFIFSGIYIGLSNLRIIPEIGNAEKPGTYIEWINDAETGKEKPVDGKYRHEIYKEFMDKFLERHGTNNR
jgi:hypothetical protein